MGLLVSTGAFAAFLTGIRGVVKRLATLGGAREEEG